MGYRPNHPERGMTYCCPECDTHKFQGRKNKHPEFKCDKCDYEFDTPEEREYKSRHPNIKHIEKLSPEDAGLSPVGERS